MSATLVKGKVKYPAGKVFNTQYGERINLVAVLPNGEEIKLWGHPGSILSSYSRGEEIVMSVENGKYKPLEVAPVADSNPTPKTAPSEPAMSQSQLISQYAVMMAECYQQMAELLDGVPPEIIQPMATSIFIQLTRKLG